MPRFCISAIRTGPALSLSVQMDLFPHDNASAELNESLFFLASEQPVLVGIEGARLGHGESTMYVSYL